MDADAISRFAASVDVADVAGETVAKTSNPGKTATSGAEDTRARVALTLAWNAINYCYFPDAGDARWFALIDGGSGKPLMLRPVRTRVEIT